MRIDTQERSCETCAFFFTYPSSQFEGECRRYPPVVTRFSGQGGPYISVLGSCQFARTISTDWCGEWQRKPQPEAT
jgi:hypothetical protein